MSRAFDPSAISEFARYYGFHYDRIDPKALVEDVLHEMERGLRGQPSCLPMIPAHINAATRIIPGEVVIALDAGGTNLRAALVEFDENGKALIKESHKAPMPGTTGHLSADAFFDEIAALTAPLLDKAPGACGIGFCFSYAMEITKDADGILMSFSKEIDAPEVIGKAIGVELKKALARRNTGFPGKIVLLNDTAATLLSGLSEMHSEDHKGGESGPVVGFILGTGVNTAYPETCIPKIEFNSLQPQIVVCEMGNFAHRYVGFLDSEFDKSTKHPGTYQVEKAAAGAYLGPLAFHIISRALRDGLFTFNKADEFLSRKGMQTKELNEFLKEPLTFSGPIGGLFNKDEKDAISSFVYIASLITNRGALLSAAVLSAAIEKACTGFNPFAPVRVAVEGSTYTLFKGMRSSLESYLHIMLNRNKPRFYSIAPVEQASLLGAAVAALSHEI